MNKTLLQTASTHALHDMARVHHARIMEISSDMYARRCLIAVNKEIRRRREEAGLKNHPRILMPLL